MNKINEISFKELIKLILNNKFKLLIKMTKFVELNIENKF